MPTTKAACFSLGVPIVNLASHDADQGVSWVRWTFDLGRDLVWTALTDPVWLRRWLGTPLGAFAIGQYTTLGDRVQIDHGQGQVQTSVVLGCELWRRLEVSWAFPGEPVSHVDIRLSSPRKASALAALLDDDLGLFPDPSAAGTELTLTHTGVGDSARDYAIAWHTHLLYLSAALRASPIALDRFWEVHERVSRAYYC